MRGRNPRRLLKGIFWHDVGMRVCGGLRCRIQVRGLCNGANRFGQILPLRRRSRRRLLWSAFGPRARCIHVRSRVRARGSRRRVIRRIVHVHRRIGCPVGSIVERCVSELFDRVAVAQPVFEVTVSNGQIRCKHQRCEKNPHNNYGARVACRCSCDQYAGGWSTQLEYRIVRLTTRG